MATPPQSISITVYTTDNPRVLVGAVAGIAWADALKGLGLKLKDSAAGQLSVEAAGTPSGIADPVMATVKAKQSSGPISLVFHDGTVTTPDGGIVNVDSGTDTGVPGLDGGVDRGEVSQPDLPAPVPDTMAEAPADAALDASARDIAVDAPALDTAVETAADTSVDVIYDAGAEKTNGAFTSPQSVEPTAKIEYGQAVAVDPVNGHVYVAWDEQAMVRVKRWSRTSGTWGETQDLKVAEGRPMGGSVQIGVETTGRVHVAWIIDEKASTASVSGIWTSQASPGEVLSLSPPQRVVANWCQELSMAVAGNGLVYLAHVIKDRGGSFYNGVHTAVYDGTTWKPDSEPLLTPKSQDFTYLSLVASDIGTAMVAFDWANNGRHTATFKLSGTTRTDTGFVDLGLEGGVESRALAMNRLGEVGMAWTTGLLALYAAKYSASAGWSTPVLLRSADDDVQDRPAVIMADDGTLTVAYAPKTDRTYNLAVQTGKIPGTFSQPKLLESDNKATIYSATDEYASEPQMAVDTAGNVLLVFRKKESDSTGSLWGTRLEGGLWREPTLLARTDGFSLLNLRLAASNAGLGAYTFTYPTNRTSPSTASQKVFVGFFQ
jgi:hypothetical protein